MADLVVGASVVATFFVQSVDPVSGAKTPAVNASPVAIRFKNPDETELATYALGSGVTNAGGGYYWASAVPTMEGLHEAEIEVEVGGVPGRGQVRFGVSPF